MLRQQRSPPGSFWILFCSSDCCWECRHSQRYIYNIYIYICIYIWVFPRIGGKPPKWMVKIMVPTLLTWMIWEYHYFWKHLYLHLFTYLNLCDMSCRFVLQNACPDPFENFKRALSGHGYGLGTPADFLRIFLIPAVSGEGLLLIGLLSFGGVICFLKSS